ncbi:MAG TPA: hypothetical protein VGB30_01090 [bacterium]|jgi:hypothetical protein
MTESGRQAASSIVEVSSVNLDRHFTTLESELAKAHEISEIISKKHWHEAEREQYPFWVGIICISLLGVIGMSLREYGIAALVVVAVMIVILVPVVFIYYRSVQGRFDRQWAKFSEDGELYKFIRDSAFELKYPVELGEPDETITMVLDDKFSDMVRVVKEYIKSSYLPDPVPLDSPPGFYVSSGTLTDPPGGDTHNVYEIEYRGLVTAPISIRIAMTDTGCNITIGFPPRPRRAETRDILTESLHGRIVDRYVAAKVLADIRSLAGLPPMQVTKPADS